MIPELRNKIPPSLFQNTTTSYKFFWAISLLELNKLTGRKVFEMKFIIARMVSDAVIVLNNNTIKLGGADHFRTSLGGLKKLYPESFGIDNRLFESLAKDINTNVVRKIVGYYSENVPYRFLTPWIGTKFNRGDLSDDELMFELDAPYSIETRESDRVVRINPSWIASISGHENELISLIIDKLGEYIDHRNVNLQSDYLAGIKNILLTQVNGSLSPNTINMMIHAESVASPVAYRQKAQSHIASPTKVSVKPSKDDAPAINKTRIEAAPKTIIVEEKDKIINGKIVEIRDPLILKDILPLVETNKLDVISILYKHYEGVEGLKMSFIDWANLIEKIRWNNISSIVTPKEDDTSVSERKTLTVAPSTEIKPKPIANRSSNKSDMADWRDLRRCLIGVQEIHAIFGDNVDFPECIVLGLRVDNFVISMRCKAWSDRTEKQYIINLLFPSVTYYSASQSLSKEEVFEMGAQVKNGKIKYKIGSKIFINSGEARVLSIEEL